MATAFSVVILAVCFALPASVTAQTDRAAPEDVRILEVVDRLREIIQQAERNRSTDRATLGALRDVVNTYDWPWRRKLLFDDFGDGNFTANPAWTVSRGDFRVVRGLGLQTSGRGDAVVSPGPADGGTGPGSGGPSVIEGILGGILKGVFERGPSTQFRANTVAAEIFTPVAIGNAFAVRVRMASRELNPSGSRIEFGPFRGTDRDWGYRLAHNPGQRPGWELIRLSPGRSAIVEKFNGAAGMGDGKARNVEWRRDRDGNMQVLVDGTEIFRTVDRGNDVFDGFAIVNSGGQYNFERIEVFGAER